VGFERIAEQKIRKAIGEGQFENPTNAGQPLDLENYFQTPADLRMGYAILKNANCLPEEVELLNEIARLAQSCARTSPNVQTTEEKRLRACRLRLSMLLERRRRSRG
jgi:Domain of unknown function (DUF1992)